VSAPTAAPDLGVDLDVQARRGRIRERDVDDVECRRVEEDLEVRAQTSAVEEHWLVRAVEKRRR
jgi:hypothetical protein